MQNAKFATVLLYQSTAINLFGGYYSGSTFPHASATQQWFHRAVSDSNKADIAFTTTFMYGYNTFDINVHGATVEGYNRPFALYYCSSVNLFGGYYEHLAPASSEIGHRVFAQTVASVLNSYGSYFNHEYMDLAVQSGNTRGTGEYVKTERARINIVEPKVVGGFDILTHDLGYGSYDIDIDSQHPITTSLQTTLAAQLNRTVRIRNLADIYLNQMPTITNNNGGSFSFQISGVVEGSDYSVRFIARNVAKTIHQDLRFNVLVGQTSTITGYEGRSEVGTTLFAQPTVSYSSGTLTITFSGNWGFYSKYAVKVVPRDLQRLEVI